MNLHKQFENILVIASRNKGKIMEYREYLDGFSFEVIPQPEDIDIVETGTTFLENARIKALEVAEITGRNALADDSGLLVEALDDAPGVFSARYAKTDKERIHRVLNELNQIKNRKAKFSCAICIASPKKEVLIEVEGISYGEITHIPRGINGFGYDPIFQESTTGLTFAEMDLSQKKIFGHRGHAFTLLREFLETVQK